MNSSEQIQNWLERYFQLLESFRFFFEINIKSLPKAGEALVIKVLPWTEGRDRRKLYQFPKYAPGCYEMPLGLFNEKLDRSTANSLSTSVTAISLSQNISIENSFAFLSFIMIFCMDYKLYTDAPDSLLFSPTYKNLLESANGDVIKAKKEYAQLTTTPIFKIKSWLGLWDQAGAYINTQLFETPNDKRGFIDYRVVPPVFVSKDNLGGKEQRAAIPDMHQIFGILNQMNSKLDCLQSSQKPEKDVPDSPILIDFASRPPQKWSDIELIFVNRDYVRIKIFDKTQKYYFSELGFKNTRKGDMYNNLWETLIDAFAFCYGEVNHSSNIPPKIKKRLKSDVNRINKKFRVLFRIEDSPFHNYRTYKAYKLKCSISEEI